MTFRVGIEVGHLLPSGTPLEDGLFPNLSMAVQRLAERAQQVWMAYAAGEPLPDGSVIHSRTGTYLRSIQLAQDGAFSAEVFSEAPHARAIEDGTPARDLKRMLDTSLKVRVTKDGRRYLIIPFRWGTPGTTGFGRNVMSVGVHDLWGSPEMKPSRVTGIGRRRSGTGAYDVKTKAPATVPERKYKWGDRLTASQIKSAGVHGQAARHMAGMVNMQKPSGKPGGGKHSQYLTFRVMVEGSSGWLVKAQPGKHPARTTADRLRPVGERVFGQAVAADIRRHLEGGE